MRPPIDHGLIVVDKPGGITSQGLVSRVKRKLKVKKAGHTGTLDPLATGVLPIAMGEATKIIPYLNEEKKDYLVRGKLGVATSTMDADGEPVDRGDASMVSEQGLLSALGRFLGKIKQEPPFFSAIKYKGKPLYHYARRGRAVVIAPREVVFYKIDLRSFDHPLFELAVRCSRGAYIRSLIHDIGKVLGCYAHVTQLRRIRTGPFSEDQAVTLERFESESASIHDKILSIEDCLASLPAVPLISSGEYKEARSGGKLRRVGRMVVDRGWTGRTLTLTHEGKVIALIKADNDGMVDYHRVLNRFPGPP